LRAHRCDAAKYGHQHNERRLRDNLKMNEFQQINVQIRDF